MTQPIDDWLRGEYGRIYLRAMVMRWIKRCEYTPLPKKRFINSSRATYVYPFLPRPTERDGVRLAAGHRIDSYHEQTAAGDHVRIELDGTEGQRLNPRGMEFEGMVCPKCGERKQFVPDFWPTRRIYTDNDGTEHKELRVDMCKVCFNKRQREYERKRYYAAKKLKHQTQNNSRYASRDKRS